MQFLPPNFAITENLGQKPTPNRFAAMDGHYRAAAIRMGQKVVAALDANDLESQAFQGLNKPGSI